VGQRETIAAGLFVIAGIDAVRRQKRYPLDKPQTAAAIVGWTAEGKSLREVVALLKARKISVGHQAVAAFVKRHQQEIDALNARAVAASEEASIASKTERLRRLEDLYRDMDAIRTGRGLIATETRMIGGADWGREVEVGRFDAALVREMRGALDDAAAEVGDRQRGPIIDNRTQILTLEALDEILGAR